MEPDHSLSVIVVSWNTRTLLERCLESVRREAAAKANGTVETIVVDNASIDGTPALIRERFPWVKLIANGTNAGFARANNQALALSTGEFVLLLNSDAVLLDGALAALDGFLAQHAAAGAVGPLLLNPDGTLQASAGPMLTPGRELWRLAFLDRLLKWGSYDQARWSTAAPRRVEVLKGACMLLRKEALDQVGYLDEGFFFYTEEVDLAFRLDRAGWELWWYPLARVLHEGGASTRQVAEPMYIELYRSKLQFFRKFGGKRQADRYKRFLRFAYWPRLIVAWALSLFSAGRHAQAHVFRRLLDELAFM
jgi:GT2 family glycosyltransferase